MNFLVSPKVAELCWKKDMGKCEGGIMSNRGKFGRQKSENQPKQIKWPEKWLTSPPPERPHYLTACRFLNPLQGENRVRLHLWLWLFLSLRWGCQHLFVHYTDETHSAGSSLTSHRTLFFAFAFSLLFFWTNEISHKNYLTLIRNRVQKG